MPFVLVGTMSDLRENKAIIEKLGAKNQTPITQEMGERLASEIAASKSMDCSALAQTNVPDVFIQAIKSLPQSVKKNKKE